MEAWYKSTGKSEEMHRRAEETKKKKYHDKGIAFNIPKNTRKCRICGKEFQPKAANQWMCERKHYKTCATCGKKFEVRTINEYKKKRTCSKECRYKLVETTSLNKYGVTNVLKSPKFKEKIKKTCLELYGTEYANQSESVKNKIKKTNLLKYGVEYSTQCEEVQNKIKATMQERYGVDYYPQTHEYKLKTERTCKEKYGVNYPCLAKQTRFSESHNISSYNIAFKSMLDLLQVPCELEFVLEDRSYDIKIGKFLIEINPSITHNSFIDVYGSNRVKSMDYHLNKSILAESYGYHCIHVWDWDNWEKIANLFAQKEQVYARKCDVVEISKKEAKEFLDKYHIQGSCNGASVNLGLVHQGKLVQVTTFGKPRYNRKFEWEILRLCSATGFSVIGGASRMFSYFKQANNPESILSYCDRSKFNGDVYLHMGMKLASEGTPNKHWYSPKSSERMQHITDNFLRQRGFDQIFGTSFGKGTSNEALMIERGYLPVYDCGQMRFEWRNQSVL